MSNLAEPLMEYKDVPDIDGVMYIHDDALLNISHVLGSTDFIPDAILGSSVAGFPLGYTDPRNVSDPHLSYRVFRNETIASVQEDKPATLRSWTHMDKCKKSIMHLFANNDAVASDYLDDNGAFIVPSPVQADFLYHPLSVAEEFATVASHVVDAKVFLECGMPLVVQMIREKTAMKVVTTPVCTDYS